MKLFDAAQKQRDTSRDEIRKGVVHRLLTIPGLTVTHDNYKRIVVAPDGGLEGVEIPLYMDSWGHNGIIQVFVGVGDKYGPKWRTKADGGFPHYAALVQHIVDYAHKEIAYVHQSKENEKARQVVSDFLFNLGLPEGWWRCKTTPELRYELTTNGVIKVELRILPNELDKFTALMKMFPVHRDTESGDKVVVLTDKGNGMGMVYKGAIGTIVEAEANNNWYKVSFDSDFLYILTRKEFRHASKEEIEAGFVNLL